MPETKLKAAVDAEMREAVDPESVEDWKKFKVGKDEFEIRPLTFKWDQVFRRYAMPMLGAQLLPVEMLVAAAVGGTTSYKVNLGISKAITASELETDELLPSALGAICAAQDAARGGKAKDLPRLDAVKYWADRVSDALMRDEIEELVEDQLNIQKALQALGKSLSTRFKVLGQLVDSKSGLSLSSLLLSSIPRASMPSAPGGRTDTTQSSSSGTSTGEPTQSTSRIQRAG